MKITIQKHSLRLDTKKYTLVDIQEEVKENFALLVSLGYEDLLNKEVVVTYGKKIRAFGTCKKIGKKPYSNKMLYEIQINKEYLAVADPKEVHNTIMHECIHCIDGCMNHGNKWKYAATRVNAKFDFTPIKRTGYDEAYHQVMETKYRYFATCDKCHTVFKWIRKGSIYNACCQNKARCSCGSNSFTCTEKPY